MADTLIRPGVRTPAFGRAATAIPGALELVGHSPAITRVKELVRRAAPLDVGVLLTAERGADVDSVARELHGRSRRAASPYVVVECDCADPSHLGQLLFGTASTLSTGPSSPPAPTDLEPIARDSRLAVARGGTLFLQDVTELPAAIQARLARIARDGEVSLDGEPVTTEVRLVASASPAVDADVHAHRLRADLFRRLAAVRIDLPPLRDRQEDVPVIATRVLEEALAERGLKLRAFTQAALALVAAVTWPGNLERTSGGHHAGGRRARRSRHSGGAHSAGAASAARARPVCPDRESTRSAVAVRARLHFCSPSASCVADGRCRPDPRDPAS